MLPDFTPARRRAAFPVPWLGRTVAALLAAIPLLAMPLGASADDSEDDDEAKKWVEVEVRWPAAPKQEDLLGFYVSPATDNRFFIDPTTLSVGSDGVIRYVLVVLTGAGARNVSFEGMRCETRERRLYAFGRSDGTWSRSRNSQWERIREASNNRHHAALFMEYFCPEGGVVKDAAEARDALRRGGHPSTVRARG